MTRGIQAKFENLQNWCQNVTDHTVHWQHQRILKSTQKLNQYSNRIFFDKIKSRFCQGCRLGLIVGVGGGWGQTLPYSHDWTFTVSALHQHYFMWSVLEDFWPKAPPRSPEMTYPSKNFLFNLTSHHPFE